MVVIYLVINPHKSTITDFVKEIYFLNSGVPIGNYKKYFCR